MPNEFLTVKLEKRSNSHILLDPPDVQIRLHELSFLKDGWYDGRESAPSNESLKELSSMFLDHYPKNASLPRIYPTLDGNVSVEWTIYNWEIGFEIELRSLFGIFIAVNLLTDEEIEKETNLKESTEWKNLVEIISSLNESIDE